MLRQVRSLIGTSLCALGALMVLGGTADARKVFIDVDVDDVGLCEWDGTGFAACAPYSALSMPVLDRLKSEGQEWTQAFVQPACTMTRVGMLTGLSSYRTGTGDVDGINTPEDGRVNMVSRPTSVQYMRENGIRTVLIGKGHFCSDGPCYDRVGFEEVYALSPSNPATDHTVTWWGYDPPLDADGNPDTSLNNFFNWFHCEGMPYGSSTNFQCNYNTEYATDVVFQAAIDIISDVSDPRDLYIKLSSPDAHAPMAETPDNLIAGCTPFRECYQGKVAYFDKKLGELEAAIEAVDPTWSDHRMKIIGDNGTPQFSVGTGGYDGFKVKSTAYVGGIHIPMVIVGDGVSVTTVTEPIQTPDHANFGPDYFGLTYTTPDNLPAVTDCVTGACVGEGAEYIFAQHWEENHGWDLPEAGDTTGFLWNSYETSAITTYNGVQYQLFWFWNTFAGGMSDPNSPDVVEFYDLTNDYFQATDITSPTGDDLDAKNLLVTALQNRRVDSRGDVVIDACGP